MDILKFTPFLVKFTPLVVVKKRDRPAGSKNKTSTTRDKSHKIERAKAKNLTKKGVEKRFF
jgi:hypothetical protein